MGIQTEVLCDSDFSSYLNAYEAKYKKGCAAVCGGRLGKEQEGQAGWTDAESGLAGVCGRPEDV